MQNQTDKVCLQVVPALGTGGVERGTIEVAAAAAAAGWRALVASSGGQGVHELRRVGGEHIELPLASKSPLTIWKNVERLKGVISNESVSIVHARSRAPAWSAYLAAQRAGASFVTTFHGVYGLGPAGLKKIYNQVMTWGRPVIAISDFIASHLVKEYGIDDNMITVVPRGVDLRSFNPEIVSSARMIKLATEWRLPDDGPVIMLPGRLTSWKGQELVVDALRVLADSQKLPETLRCLFVGPGSTGSSFRSRLESKVSASGLQGHIQLIEDCRDIAAAYMITDVVVSASTRPEAFGRVVAEGQAMGRPVVAPAHGAAPEILLSGVTGWLFTPGDALSLAGALEQALALSAGQRAEMAQTARAHISENYNLDFMTASTLAVYEEALACNAGASVA